MTIGSALNTFFNSFGIDAYAEGNVPTNVAFPYLTYSQSLSDFGGGDTSITVQVWYKTDSEAVPNAKVKEIADVIGRGGKMIDVDDGAIWVKKGAPFSVSGTDASDSTIKLRQLNITLEYLI